MRYNILSTCLIKEAVRSKYILEFINILTSTVTLDFTVPILVNESQTFHHSSTRKLQYCEQTSSRSLENNICNPTAVVINVPDLLIFQKQNGRFYRSVSTCHSLIISCTADLALGIPTSKKNEGFLVGNTCRLKPRVKYSFINCLRLRVINFIYTSPNMYLHKRCVCVLGDIKLSIQGTVVITYTLHGFSKV